MRQYLQATKFFDYENHMVKDFVEETTKNIVGPIDQAIALYYQVRDSIRYDPYTFRNDEKTFSASHVLENETSYCIPKAVLLGAAARYKGIPSRLGLADVVNHLSDPAFLEKMRTNVFSMHGYIELYLGEKWVKATPAFNVALCERYGVVPLEFDGLADSIFHEFTGEGDKYMEYIKDYGVFADLPHGFIIEKIKATYPHLADAVERGEWMRRD